MKALPFKYIFFALALIPLVASAHVDGDKLNGRYTKEKTIKKEFNVNSDALLKVDNSYGNLNITSWNENRVVIEVHVKTNGNDEDRVKERLNEINVDFENSSSMVSARTDFGNRSNSWGWSWGKRKKSKRSGKLYD